MTSVRGFLATQKAVVWKCFKRKFNDTLSELIQRRPFSDLASSHIEMAGGNNYKQNQWTMVNRFNFMRLLG